MAHHPVSSSPIGYQWLRGRYDLKASPILPPAYLRSKTAKQPGIRLVRDDLAPADTFCGHLEFALKHEGLDLPTLKELFRVSGSQPIERALYKAPLAKHMRRAAFLYEWFGYPEIGFDGLSRGNYVDVLPDDQYVCLDHPDRDSRFRVNNNLPGVPDWCPLIRKTEKIQSFQAKGLSGKTAEILRGFDSKIIERAVNYLYYKEIKSSAEIEREYPDKRRQARFVNLIQSKLGKSDITKAELLEVQAVLLDPRFASNDYRDDQNYIGETLGPGREYVHYVSPRPQDVHAMMGGLLQAAQRCRDRMSAVDQAAALSFSFVFIHPFDDGNGRTHRYLIHRILSREKFTEPGIVLPVSAHILRNQRDYDGCLEQFSVPIKKQVSHTLHPEGLLEVHDDAGDQYRYFDATPMAEYLWQVTENTIEMDFKAELEFVKALDAAKTAIQHELDIPEKILNAYLSLCLQRGGEMSKSKRQHKQFDSLRDREKDFIEAETMRALSAVRKRGDRGNEDILGLDLPTP